MSGRRKPAGVSLRLIPTELPFVLVRKMPIISSFDEALDRVNEAADKFNPDKLKMDDPAKTGGG